MAGKYKIKPVPVIIAGVAVVGLVVALIIFTVKNSSNEQQSNTATVSVSQKNLKNNVEINTEPVKAATTVEIQLEDSAVVIGTTFKVTAIVTPEDTEHALVWSSSNEDIVSVDNEGVVTVKGTGTVAITATVGTVSDSVIIEGIESASTGSDRGLPLYTGNSYIASSTDDNSSSSVSNSGNSSVQNGNSSNNTVSSNYNNSSNGNNNSSSNNNSDDDNSSVNSDNNGSSSNSSNSNGNTSSNNSSNSSNSSSNTGGSSNSQSSNSNNQSGDSSSDSGSHSGVTSTQISDYLPGIGFSQRMSNVYVCEEGDTYYGEIITQPSVTIVYIKQRSAKFDAMIQSTLSTLLPTEASQVWNNYVSSSSDRTFTVDGRRVRIVTALNGGHSQIVIYN